MKAKLQSYFDGELSIEMMESATSHLASCVTCAAAARELEQETALLTTALAAEFEASCADRTFASTDRCGRVGSARVASSPSNQTQFRFFGSFPVSSTLAHSEHLGYASLVVVLAFAAIFGVVKMRSRRTTCNSC